MVQWYSAFAAMAMLSATTWVQVPSTTSGVIVPVIGFLHSLSKPQPHHQCIQYNGTIWKACLLSWYCSTTINIKNGFLREFRFQSNSAYKGSPALKLDQWKVADYPLGYTRPANSHAFGVRLTQLPHFSHFSRASHAITPFQKKILLVF